MKGILSSSMFLSMLEEKIVNVDMDLDHELLAKHESQEEQYSRNFILRHLKDKNLLLILCNIEDYFNQNQNDMVKEFNEILESCHNLKVLITSQQRISNIEHWNEYPYILQPLSEEASVELLLDLCPRQIENNEITTLLKMHIPQ